MPGIADLQFPTRDVSLGDRGTLTFRGLSVADLSFTLPEHADTMSEAFDKVAEATKGKKVAPEEAIRIMKDVAQSFPMLIASLLATAADEPEKTNGYLRLPFPDTIRCIEAVFYATFTSDEEVGNLVEVVMRAVTGVENLRVVKLPDSPSLPTSGVSAGKSRSS